MRAEFPNRIGFYFWGFFGLNSFKKPLSNPFESVFTLWAPNSAPIKLDSIYGTLQGGVQILHFWYRKNHTSALYYALLEDPYVARPILDLHWPFGWSLRRYEPRILWFQFGNLTFSILPCAYKRILSTNTLFPSQSPLCFQYNSKHWTFSSSM